MSGVKGKSGVYKRTIKNKENLSDTRKKGLLNGTIVIWNKGKEGYSQNLTDKQREQLSKRMIGNKSTKGKFGKNSNNWKGGISKDAHSLTNPKYKKWREKIFKRDNWTCQKCGERGCYLEPHHIKSWAKFPKLRYVLSNGQTLCLECHKLTDNYKGKNNK